jgi:ADP-ribose pyrophosphatase
MQPPIITHTGPVFRVESIETRDRLGRAVRRDVVRHPGAVTVIPVLPDGRLVVIRNHRVAVGRALVEFCAGKLEPGPDGSFGGEDPRGAALRELEEECGYRARSIEPLGMFYTSPGFADERMFVFLATDLEPVEQRLEPGEEIAVEVVAETEFRRWIAEGIVVDGKTLGAYLLYDTRRRGA